VGAAIGDALVADAALLHLVRGGLDEALGVGLCADGGGEVDPEGDCVEGEDDGDDPLEDGGGVVVVGEVAAGKGYGEDDLDEDKGELDPEGDAEDAVFAVYLVIVRLDHREEG
jgi:hypothetical protein